MLLCANKGIVAKIIIVRFFFLFSIKMRIFGKKNMKHTVLLFLTIILATCTAMQDKELSSVERLDVTLQNEFYTGNRPPLQPAQLIKIDE
jgi:hypothetical protein